jgi:hypothetical protein
VALDGLHAPAPAHHSTGLYTAEPDHEGYRSDHEDLGKQIQILPLLLPTCTWLTMDKFARRTWGKELLAKHHSETGIKEAIDRESVRFIYPGLYTCRAHTHEHAHIVSHTYTCTLTRWHLHTCTCTLTHTCTHSTHTHLHTLAHPGRTHLYTHLHTYTHTHTHAHTRTCTYKHNVMNVYANISHAPRELKQVPEHTCTALLVRSVNYGIKHRDRHGIKTVLIYNGISITGTFNCIIIPCHHRF